VFTTNFSYQIPFRRSRWYGGWDWSGIATGRTGLPINVTVTRTAASLPDGNALSAERPNVVPGVSPYLDYGTTGRWLNPAAFAIPSAGQFGNLGRNTLRAPGLFQVDTALSKRVPLSERVGFEFGWQIFNIANHPQLGPPASNLSSSSNFGRITAPVNPSPIGAGTPRQMQVIGRFYF